jgi:hypothetical protein
VVHEAFRVPLIYQYVELSIIPANAMHKILALALALSGLLLGPGAALAQTYEYVNVNSQIMTIEAANADAAIVAAPDRASASGVILINDPSDPIPATTTVTVDPTPPVTQTPVAPG